MRVPGVATMRLYEAVTGRAQPRKNVAERFHG
jgi:hypothetical protein